MGALVWEEAKLLKLPAHCILSHPSPAHTLWPGCTPWLGRSAHWLPSRPQGTGLPIHLLELWLLVWRRVVCSQGVWSVEPCTTELPAVPLLTGLQRSVFFCEAPLGRAQGRASPCTRSCLTVSERSLVLL